MTSAQGTRFEPGVSRTLSMALAAMVVLAAVSPWLTALPWAARCLLSGTAAVLGAWRMARLRQPVVCGLAWTWDDIWTVTDRRGVTHLAELVGFRTVRRSVFLHLRWRHGAGHVALLPDNTEPDSLRLLRARLGRGG